MKKATDIEGKIKAIICDKLKVDERDITARADLQYDLGADSLDIVEIIFEFEKEFDITIPDEEAEKINTVGEVVEYISRRSEQRMVEAVI